MKTLQTNQPKQKEKKPRIFSLRQNRYLWAIGVFTKQKHPDACRIKGRRKDGSIRKQCKVTK